MARRLFTVNERTSGRYTATLKDEKGVTLGGGNLTTLTLTLHDVPGGTIVNSRQAQNALNANGVTVDGTGLVAWVLEPADTQILDSTREQERHRALFQWTYAGGLRGGTHEVDFLVKNLNKV